MTQPFEDYPVERMGEDAADTVELEISAEQMLALTRAAAPAQPAPVVVESVAPRVSSTDERLPRIVPPGSPLDEARTRVRWHAGRVTALASIAVATAIAASGIAYLATTGDPPLQVADNTDFTDFSAITPDPAPQPAPESPPVRFPNPFDASEIFEFPSGTSEAEARDAVADLLLERARGRHVSSPQLASKRKKYADKGAPVVGTKLVHRN